jgi:hypothetical protein
MDLYVAQHRLAAAEHVQQQLDGGRPADRGRASGESAPIRLEARREHQA